jgi:hypothetical protein
MADESTTQSNNLKIAIIVPYRDIHPTQKRASHLAEFVPYMTSFMERAINNFNKNATFHIFIIEQSPEEKFNRGALLNVGFSIASNQGYNVFIFHDVDLLPDDTLLEYYVKNPVTPIHIASCWKRYQYQNQEYLGGIVSISSKNYSELNGYPNNYWGWGGEDDELRRRVNDIGLQIESPTGECNIRDLEEMTLEQKLQQLRENSEWKNMKKDELKKAHASTWQMNGINAITQLYTEITSKNINEATTQVTVKLLHTEEDDEDEDDVDGEEQKQVMPKKKKDTKKIKPIYSRCLITRNISLPITAIGKNILQTLEESIGFNFEGKCLVEGYVKPSSSKIITHSSGLIERGNHISFEVVFECEICFPVEGTKIICVAKNITKAGIRAESAFESPSPIVVFIARDHHYNTNNTYFSTIKENDRINVRVIGQRFELNDKYVSIIGQLLKPDVDYKSFKPKLTINK